MIEMFYHRNLAIVLIVTVSTATAYSGGAPTDTCEDMTPKHPSPPQSDKTFPYKVSLNSNEIKSGEKAEITISGGDFKGFLLEVRDEDKPVGTFDIPDHHRYAKAIGCSGKRSAATHKNSATKKDLTLEWKPPRGAKGKDYTVYVTVARDGDTYWVHQPTENLKIV
ncbi:cytochrome b561/ferric reductase transmembrane [Holotrichia oblita]|uniref:Cytochrome b561/ferric reductase transmembrane n=2 Tax=Holotrichia oblita TaxID=644536 RepID=A0ACB9THU2_HOLOL|nr:cytochrome b561/ferric reductase transmembrane [Holotrichia oblita]KAI4466493.1 cytochrome b561/ferric reductase transmembrane [Holotrichia oblita]